MIGIGFDNMIDCDVQGHSWDDVPCDAVTITSSTQILDGDFTRCQFLASQQLTARFDLKRSNKNPRFSQANFAKLDAENISDRRGNLLDSGDRGSAQMSYSSTIRRLLGLRKFRSRSYIQDGCLFGESPQREVSPIFDFD